MQADSGQHAQLGARVIAIEVVGGVGFREAPPLRLGKDLRERQAVGLHRRQHVVAGPVEDAGDADETVSRQALANGADDRDSAGDRRFEAEMDATLGGEAQQFTAFVRHELFVRRDDRFTRGDGLALPVAGRVEPSHDFDEDLGIRRQDLVDAGRPAHGVGHPVNALAVHIAIEDVGQRQRSGGSEDQAGDGPADGAESQECNLHAGEVSVSACPGRRRRRMRVGSSSREPIIEGPGRRDCCL